METIWIVRLIVGIIILTTIISVLVWASRKGYIKPTTWTFNWKWLLVFPAFPFLLFLAVCLYWLGMWSFAFADWSFRPAHVVVPKQKRHVGPPPEQSVVPTVSAFRPCVSAHAKVEPLGPVMTSTIPASDFPEWGFGAVGPVGVHNIKWTVSVRVDGQLPADYKLFYVDGDTGQGIPLDFRQLEGMVNTDPTGVTTVKVVSSFPFIGKMNGNEGPGLTVWYVQSNAPHIRQTVTTGYHLPPEVELAEVTIGREEVVIDLSILPFKSAWVVPMRDASHQSNIGGDGVPVGGVSEAAWQQTYSRMIPPAGGKKATKAFAELPYQALIVQKEGEDPKVFDRHIMMSMSGVSGQQVRLRLNADPSDLLAGVCKPAKVIVGRVKK